MPTKDRNRLSTIEKLEDQVAAKVVSESLHLKKGDSLTVETWNNGFPLATKVVLEARKLGAHPIMIFEDEDAYVEGVKNTPKDAIGKMGKHEYQLLSATDAYFFIPNEVLEGYTKRLTAAEVDQATTYGDSWYEAAEKAKLRGARMSFGFAGKELAKILGKKLDEVVAHQLKATLVDFSGLKSAGKQLESQMIPNTVGVIDSGGAELEFEFGDGGRVEDGVVDEDDVSAGNNMSYLPPGMVVKNIKRDSLNGKVKLSATLSWRGILDDAVLEFEGGRLTTWSSKNSKKMLDSLISDQPESEREVSSLIIGLNPAIRYGYGQDRFVEGSIGLSGLEFTGILRKGTLRANQSKLVEKGKLVTKYDRKTILLPRVERKVSPLHEKLHDRFRWGRLRTCG
ncbi:MAG: aminopeptidase [Thaumarchaeota archaeon]|nr:aminopeptidase [Nitrososphaerota archaeon]